MNISLHRTISEVGNWPTIGVYCKCHIWVVTPPTSRDWGSCRELHSSFSIRPTPNITYSRVPNYTANIDCPPYGYTITCSSENYVIFYDDVIFFVACHCFEWISWFWQMGFVLYRGENMKHLQGGLNVRRGLQYILREANCILAVTHNPYLQHDIRTHQVELLDNPTKLDKPLPHPLQTHTHRHTHSQTHTLYLSLTHSLTHSLIQSRMRVY
jgi:hypothetical protein